MQGIFAEIRWRTPEEGGRREPLPVGHWYSPHIRLSADASEQPWSVFFDVTASDTTGRSRICFRFLADDEILRNTSGSWSPDGSYGCMRGPESWPRAL